MGERQPFTDLHKTPLVHKATGVFLKLFTDV